MFVSLQLLLALAVISSHFRCLCCAASAADHVRNEDDNNRLLLPTSEVIPQQSNGNIRSTSHYRQRATMPGHEDKKWVGTDDELSSRGGRRWSSAGGGAVVDGNAVDAADDDVVLKYSPHTPPSIDGFVDREWSVIKSHRRILQAGDWGTGEDTPRITEPFHQPSFNYPLAFPTPGENAPPLDGEGVNNDLTKEQHPHRHHRNQHRAKQPKAKRLPPNHYQPVSAGNTQLHRNQHNYYHRHSHPRRPHPDAEQVMTETSASSRAFYNMFATSSDGEGEEDVSIGEHRDRQMFVAGLVDTGEDKLFMGDSRPGASNGRELYMTEDELLGVGAAAAADDLFTSPRPWTTIDQDTVNASHGQGLLLREVYDHWPTKHESVVEGDLILGGLMMVHEREDSVTCGPIMPQGGIQALEAMLYTLDRVNEMELLPDFTLGAHILDDCDKDTYGLEMAVDFIKGTND